jgi:hypothetical protein
MGTGVWGDTTAQFPLGVVRDGPFTLHVSVTTDSVDANSADNVVDLVGMVRMASPRLVTRTLQMSLSSVVKLQLKCVRASPQLRCDGDLRFKARRGQRTALLAMRHYEIAPGHSTLMKIRLARWAKHVVRRDRVLKAVVATRSPGGTAKASSRVTIVPYPGE